MEQNSETVLECSSRWVQRSCASTQNARPGVCSEYGYLSSMSDSDSAAPCDTSRALSGPCPPTKLNRAQK